MQAELRLALLATPSPPQDSLAEPWPWGAYTGALAQALPLQVSPQPQLAVIRQFPALLYELRQRRCSRWAPAAQALRLLSCHYAAGRQHEHALPPAAPQGPPCWVRLSLLLPSLWTPPNCDAPELQECKPRDPRTVITGMGMETG